jgi:hypothetical protein
VFLLHHELSVLDVSSNCLKDIFCKFYNGSPVSLEVKRVSFLWLVAVKNIDIYVLHQVENVCNVCGVDGADAHPGFQPFTHNFIWGLAYPCATDP